MLFPLFIQDTNIKKNRLALCSYDTLLLGLIFLSAFLVQELYAIKWPWLVQIQTNNVYKQISGFLLLIFILNQWHLSLLRIQNKMHIAHRELERHKLIGATAPVFFYFHSHSFGYAYLFILSSVFLGNVLIGLLHPIAMNCVRKWILKIWVVVTL